MRHTRGVTLLELLTVVGIVAILAALTLPALSQARARAGRTRCSQEMRQAALAVVLYREDNEGRLPCRESQATWDRELSRYCGNLRKRPGHEWYWYQHTRPFTSTVYRLGVGDNRHRPYPPFGWDVSVKSGEVRAWVRVQPGEAQ